MVEKDGVEFLVDDESAELLARRDPRLSRRAHRHRLSDRESECGPDLRLRNVFRSSAPCLKTNRSRSRRASRWIETIFATTIRTGARGGKAISLDGRSPFFSSSGLAFAAWLGSFYIFGQPERPESYRILKKLHKIDPTKRFELTAAPAGEFLTAKQLYDRYIALQPDGTGEDQRGAHSELHPKFSAGARSRSLCRRALHYHGSARTDA